MQLRGLPTPSPAGQPHTLEPRRQQQAMQSQYTVTQPCTTRGGCMHTPHKTNSLTSRRLHPLQRGCCTEGTFHNTAHHIHETPSKRSAPNAFGHARAKVHQTPWAMHGGPGHTHTCYTARAQTPPPKRAHTKTGLQALSLPQHPTAGLTGACTLSALCPEHMVADGPT